MNTYFPFLQISGKEICSLSKEQFLARAPPFMGDILWAHMEILQKEVDTRAANIENMPSNYSEQSFDSRTYTQLDSGSSPNGPGVPQTSQPPPPPPLLPSTPAAMAIAAAGQQVSSSPASSTITTSTYTSRGHCMYPGMEPTAYSSAAEYETYGSAEMKYSQQMAAAAAAGRVPHPYPTAPYYPDQPFEQDWQYPAEHAWQPTSTTSDFHSVNSSSTSPPSTRPHTTITPSSVAIQTPTSSITSTSSPMHQHPAFLQVCN